MEEVGRNDGVEEVAPVEPVTSEELLQAGELRFEFFRSSGPGGQNVNKVSTAVRLRFDVESSRILPEGVKERLARKAGNRMTGDGVLVIEAGRFRTQDSNRRDALRRLSALITVSWEPQVERRPTRKKPASERRRIEEKRRRGTLKRGRSRVVHDTEP
jgi:ribosome-associated protein